MLPRDTDEAAWLARDHNDKVEGRTALDYATGSGCGTRSVRDPSFVDAGFIAMLRELDVALVVADTGGRWPEYADLTSDFVYVRLHGASELYVSGYSPRAIASWARRIVRWAQGEQADDVRVIGEGARSKPRPSRRVLLFRQHRQEARAGNARALMRKLGVGSGLTVSHARRRAAA